MTKERIQSLIDGLPKYKSVKEIEMEIKIPPTTLQKVLKGERLLPKKWIKPLEDYFNINPPEVIEKSDEEKKVHKDKEKVSVNLLAQFNAIKEQLKNKKNGNKN